MFSFLLQSIFTVQILYRLYSLLLNCTYSNYTQAAATCSAAQQHSTFTVQILYKLYSLQLNSTYSNYTQAAATCSAAQQHTNFPVDIFISAVQSAILILHVSVRIHSVRSLVCNFQINATAPKHSVTSSQHYETNPTAPLFGNVCVCRQRSLDT